MASSSVACPLDALAEIAAQSLIIALPDSPQGKPFIDRAEAGTPASLLRAIRRRLNLTQREFGILLSPGGASPISPSVICQLESALQTVPAQLVTRAVAATTAAQRLGEYLCGLGSSKATDAAGALRLLGPGCIDGLQPYLDASPDLPSEEAQLVKEFLSIVTKRRHSTGGSRPGARGPYRKLSKLSGGTALPAPAPAAAANGAAPAPPPNPPALEMQSSAGSSPRFAPASYSPRAPGAEGEPTSGRSTPSSSVCSTPGSSRGSSRPRSPTSTTGYESNATLSDRFSDYSSSLPGTPNAGAAQLLGSACKVRKSSGGSGEVSLEVLMALRRLQEENESLQQENKRLRAMVPEAPRAVGEAPAASAEAAPTEVSSSSSDSEMTAPAELSRADVGMSC